MHPWNRSIILAFSLILVLAVSAMAVQPALADDSTPPPPAPSTGSVPAAPTGNSLPAKVPSGTDVVVLDRSGNSVPLASQKAAQIVASGDPIWCPKGVAPRPGVGGCSPAINDTKFGTNASGDLLNWLVSNDPLKKLKAGAIWIANDYISGSVEPLNTSFTLNGSTLTNMSKFSLDINGGWSGTPGSKAIVKTSPSEFDASLSIINWHAPITLSDIKVTGVSANPNGNYALMVQTDKGGITLNRVQAILNSAPNIGGALLDNRAAAPGHPASVTVNDSVFYWNGGYGLTILSDGAVKIRNLTADYNGTSPTNGIGTSIDNTHSNLNQPVTLTGTNEFMGNYGTGLDINSNGAVILNNITAYNNGDFGLFIENDLDTSPSLVKLTGTNWLMYNQVHGLAIISNGNVSLNNINASFNRSNGAEISNNSDLLKPQPVTISGTNSFYGNTYDGLDIYSFGAIKLSNITANNNAGGYGAYLDNSGYSSMVGVLGGDTVITRMPVTLTGVNTFDNNSSGGLYVYSAGAITVSNVYANNNGSGGDGVFLWNYDEWYPNFGAFTPYAANVTISGFGTFENNGQDGIDIFSVGAVKLANIKADYNGINGADIRTIGFLAPQSVTLSGMNNFNHNGFGGTAGVGLLVLNDGKITISNLSAIDNKLSGAILDNYTNRKLNKYQGVTLTGFNTFQQNQGSTSGSNYFYGLYIATDGSATMSHIISAGNNSIGVYVSATRNVTLMCGSAWANLATGFDLTSGGTMTLTGVQDYFNTPDESLTYITLHRTSACP